MTPPSIPPSTAESPRPFWSVMIPAYRPRWDYLEEALAGVLAQDPGPAAMQVEVVVDGPGQPQLRARVRERWGHRVAVVARGRRLGIAGSWNDCVARARGQWVHLLHQDDRVLPGFYARLREGIESRPSVGAAFTQHYRIDGTGRNLGPMSRVAMTEAGILRDWPEHVFTYLGIQTPSIVVRRAVYEELGGFDPGLRYVLDWDMWQRIAVRYPIWYHPEPLACYRKHRGSATSSLLRSGRNIVEIRASIEAFHGRLPPSIASAVVSRARKRYRGHAARTAARALVRGAPGAAVTQLREGARLSGAGLAGAAGLAGDFARFLPRAVLERVPLSSNGRAM